MYVVGAGFACPETELSNQFLEELGLKLDQSDAKTIARAGVHSRRVSLPLDYIASTRNSDAKEGRNVALTSPTALGAEAAKQAMQRAGITSEQIGLIIADSATPYQTCPSEAQRIGGALGVKVPAFDVTGGASVLPLYIEMLSNWKPERVPDYVLCVSTNTLSQHVHYEGSAVPAYLFGDGAAALVISLRNKGKFYVQDSHMRREGRYRPAVAVGHHVSFSIGHLPPEKELFQMIAQGLKRLEDRFNINLSNTYLAGPPLFAGDVAGFSRELGIAPDHICAPTARYGYSLGASVGAAISDLWDTIKPGEHLAVMHAGDGQWSGNLLLASE